VLIPVALLTVGVFCQSFEVASVKVSRSTGGRITMSGGPGTSDPGRISYTNITLRRVLLASYDVKSYQLIGPDWLDIARFDIAAKIPEGATKEELQAMLRELLASRFKMTTHRESKELSVYTLLVAKNGPKIKPQAPDVGSTGEEQVAGMQKDKGRDGFPVLSLPTARPGTEGRG
jgi:uncharacterized protein (TIGR03435 family)